MKESWGNITVARIALLTAIEVSPNPIYIFIQEETLI